MMRKVLYEYVAIISLKRDLCCEEAPELSASSDDEFRYE